MIRAVSLRRRTGGGSGLAHDCVRASVTVSAAATTAIYFGRPGPGAYDHLISSASPPTVAASALLMVIIFALFRWRAGRLSVWTEDRVETVRPPPVGLDRDGGGAGGSDGDDDASGPLGLQLTTVRTDGCDIGEAAPVCVVLRVEFIPAGRVRDILVVEHVGAIGVSSYLALRCATDSGGEELVNAFPSFELTYAECLELWGVVRDALGWPEGASDRP